MATVSAKGAIQIEVTVNGYSVTVEKKNLVSLKVARVIGDSANEFTLECFDETAFQLESALIGTSLASITVRYCMADNLTNAICFSGTCIDYQITFTGRATMLSITGILAATAELSSGYTFTKRAIEWCGSQPVLESGTLGDADATYSIDGKSQSLWSQYESVNDVCAIVKLDDNNNPIPYFNPARIFKRIIHKYNNDTLGTTGNSDSAGWGTGGSGYFKIAEVYDNTRWVADLSTCQESTQTTSQYITNILCKGAVTYTNGKEDDLTNEISGYKYWVDAKGHHFMPLDYSSSSTTSKLTIYYGMQNSNVISFSVANVGSIAMCGTDTESRKEAQKSSLLQNSSLDYLYASTITSGTDNEETDSAYENWWNLDGKTMATYVKSSSSASAISTITKNSFDGLESMIYSAELTIWGDFAHKYSPGDYIDITVLVGKNNTRHYSSGIYMILQIDDSISQDGFTQSMKLLKNTSAITSVTTSTTENSNNTDDTTETIKTRGTTAYTSSNGDGSGGLFSSYSSGRTAYSSSAGSSSMRR